MKSFSFRRVAIISNIILTATFGANSFAGQAGLAPPHAKGGGQGHHARKGFKKATPMSIFQAEKVIKFKITTLATGNFILLGCWVGELPKGFAGKLQTPEQVVMLEYGWKKGGILKIYETPAVNGIAQKDYIKQVVSCGEFVDGYWLPGYTITGATIGGVFVSPTSTKQTAIQEADANLNIR